MEKAGDPLREENMRFEEKRIKATHKNTDEHIRLERKYK